MEDEEEKEKLCKWANSERKNVITEGTCVLNFLSVTALAKVHFKGSTQHVSLVNDNTVVLCFIQNSYIWDVKDNRMIKTFDNDYVTKVAQIGPNKQIEIRRSDCLIIESSKLLATIPIRVDDIALTSSSIVLGNQKKLSIVKRDDYTMSKEIPFQYLHSNDIGERKKVQMMISLDDYYIAALITNEITLFNIREGQSQGISTIVLDDWKNKFCCFVDLSNGRIKKQDKPPIESMTNHCILIASGIPKRIQSFKGETFFSIKPLLENDKVIRIDKIDKGGRYLFIMEDYFYVYDTFKQEYVQKISSLLTTSYCFSANYFIYFSTPVFYSVKLQLEEQCHILSK